MYHKLAALEADRLKSAAAKSVSVPPFDAVNSAEARAYRAAFDECLTDENYLKLFESKLAEVQDLEERVPVAIKQSSSQAREETLRKAEIVKLLADIDQSKEKVASLQDTCRSQQQNSKRFEELHKEEARTIVERTASGDHGMKTADIEMQVFEMEQRLIEKQQSNREQRKRLDEIRMHMFGRQKRREDLVAHDVLRKKLKDAVQAQRTHLLLQIDTKIGQMEAHIVEIQRRNAENRFCIDTHNSKHIEHDKALQDYKSFVAQLTETRQLKETIMQTLQEQNALLRQELALKDVAFIQQIDLRAEIDREVAQLHESNREKDEACKMLQARLKALKGAKGGK